MSGAPDPSAKLGEAIGPVAKTFTELGSQIGDSGFTEQWKCDGLWAAKVLADMLGQDWLGRFEARSSRPYLKFVLAPRLLPQLASTMEFAARLWLLSESPGLGDVRQHMRTQLEPGVMAHTNLQLEVAALEKRRSGAVAMEVDQGAGHWKPDVILSHAGASIGVECLRLSVADDVASHLGTPGGPEKVVDGWRRIAAKIFVKAGQPAQAGGWLRCELDDGMFADTPWFRSALAGMSLAERAAALWEGARQVMETTGSIHGIVLSSPAASGMGKPDETHRLPNGWVALRRGLPGGRTRETFIVRSSHAVDSEVEMWAALYDQEPTWLDSTLEIARTAGENP